MVILIQLLGGIALLLWGLRMVRTGVMRAYGTTLKRLAQRSEGRILPAFFSGLLVTVTLQSSTATALIASTFAGQGVLSITTAFITILGADVGTSIAVIIASQKITSIAPLLISLGVFGFLASPSSQRENTFRAILGLGLILLALSSISTTAVQLSGFNDFMVVLRVLEDEPFILLLCALMLTYLAHSSLAVVLLCIGFVSSGLIGLSASLAIVLGANLGSGLLPVIANWKASKASQGPVISNLLIRGIAVLALYPFIGLLIDHSAEWIQRTLIPALTHAGLEPQAWLLVPMAPAAFHFGLNVFVALFGMIFSKSIVSAADHLLPEPLLEKEDPSEPKHLDVENLSQPTAALACARREVLHMAAITQQMLLSVLPVLRDNDKALCTEVSQQDDSVDNLYVEIKFYLAKVMQNKLTRSESQQAVDILSFTTNMEHIGDIIDRSLMGLADNKITDQLSFSQAGLDEIIHIHETVSANFELAINTFVSGDSELAHQLFETKAKMRKLVDQSVNTHLKRIGKGIPQSLVTSSYHVDVLRDLKRINSHLSAAAYPVLIAAGEVPKTRWKQKKLIKPKA